MRTNVVCALADVVATKLGIILLFSFFPTTNFSPRRGLPTILNFCANVVRVHAVMHARADVVATKLGIILLFLSFLPLAFLPEGVCLRF